MPDTKLVAHWTEIEGGDVNHYDGDDELMSLSASFAHHFNLTRLGIHHERLTPGRRVSWPHAEADEDEFVFVIEGEPDLWIDGELRRLKAGDGVGFPSGTGISHLHQQQRQGCAAAGGRRALALPLSHSLSASPQAK